MISTFRDEKIVQLRKYHFCQIDNINAEENIWDLYIDEPKFIEVIQNNDIGLMSDFLSDCKSLNIIYRICFRVTSYFLQYGSATMIRCLSSFLQMNCNLLSKVTYNADDIEILDTVLEIFGIEPGTEQALNNKYNLQLAIRTALTNENHKMFEKLHTIYTETFDNPYDIFGGTSKLEIFRTYPAESVVLMSKHGFFPHKLIVSSIIDYANRKNCDDRGIKIIMGILDLIDSRQIIFHDRLLRRLKLEARSYWNTEILNLVEKIDL
jgi:hypothetical protein